VIKLALSWQKFFRRRGIRDLLPVRPVSITRVEPWWVIHVGFVTEDDIRVRRGHSFVDFGRRGGERCEGRWVGLRTGECVKKNVW